jgi:hypothetical protein
MSFSTLNFSLNASMIACDRLTACGT